MLLNKDTLEPLLKACREISIEAGAAILQVYNSDFAVQHKDDKSPLTEADLAAHKIIDARLKALTPDLPVISEEAATLPFEQRQTWQTYWLIDPLDGTREFVKRNDEFTVNIALIHDHKVVLGVVYVPVIKSIYSAAEGLHAWRSVADGEQEQINCRPLDMQHLKLASSRSHGSEALQNFGKAIGPHESNPMGSSLKFCIVAEGNADLYPRLGLTSEWDTAAAQCVVEQAGGHVTTIDMEPLRYNTKDSLLNPFFFVFGSTWKDWSEYLDSER
jgi:3'(2'), 5'-bisphosphate nucleotidase